MARTRVWGTEESNYTDATLQRSIDNKGTELRIDTREVVNQLLGVAEGTALADPVVATGGGTLAAVYPLAIPQTYTIHVPWNAFLWQLEQRDTEGGAAYIQYLYTTNTAGTNLAIGADSAYGQVGDPTAGGVSQSGKVAGFAPLILPAGVTITGGKFYFYRNAAAEQVTFSILSHVDTSAAGSITEATVTSTGTTTASLVNGDLGTIAVAVGSTKWYQLKLTITGSGNNTQQRLYGATITYTSPTANIRI